MIDQVANGPTIEDQKALQVLLDFVESVPPDVVRSMYCSSTGMAQHDVRMAVQVQIAQGNEALRQLFPELPRL